MLHRRNLRYGQGRKAWYYGARPQCLASRMNNRILRAPNLAGIAESAVRLVNLRAPIFLVYSYVIGLCLVYAIVMVHIPMGINPKAGYDDNLFMSLGRYLSEGDWLGPF